MQYVFGQGRRIYERLANVLLVELGEVLNGARFLFRRGGNEPSPVGFSPVTVPVGKGYRLVQNDRCVPNADLIIVLSPATAKAGLAVVQIQGDPARVDALLQAVSFR